MQLFYHGHHDESQSLSPDRMRVAQVKSGRSCRRSQIGPECHEKKKKKKVKHVQRSEDRYEPSRQEAPYGEAGHDRRGHEEAGPLLEVALHFPGDLHEGGGEKVAVGEGEHRHERHEGGVRVEHYGQVVAGLGVAQQEQGHKHCASQREHEHQSLVFHVQRQVGARNPSAHVPSVVQQVSTHRYEKPSCPCRSGPDARGHHQDADCREDRH